MVTYDEEGWADVGYTSLYYCMVCEKFFRLSPIAPTRCPTCFCDARYILGPLPTEEVDLNKLKAKRRKKYKGKMSR